MSKSRTREQINTEENLTNAKVNTSKVQQEVGKNLAKVLNEASKNLSEIENTLKHGLFTHAAPEAAGKLPKKALQEQVKKVDLAANDLNKLSHNLKEMEPVVRHGLLTQAAPEAAAQLTDLKSQQQKLDHALDTLHKLNKQLNDQRKLISKAQGLVKSEDVNPSNRGPKR